MTCNRAEAIAHSVFHKICEKPGATGEGPPNRKCCHIFELGKIVELNQRFAIVRRRLPTLLSTEVVYNWGMS
jgi:hypothetical protein